MTRYRDCRTPFPVPGAAFALLLAALPPLYAAAVRWMLRRNLARPEAGDPEPMLAAYADDVHFIFPGRSSWAAELRGKAAVRRWLERFLRVGLRFDVVQILVSGPPWDTTVGIWFTDRLAAPDRTVVYENQGTIVATIAWGKVTSYEVYEDTQQVAALDAYLDAQSPGEEPTAA